MINRRSFVQLGGIAATSALLGRRASAQDGAAPDGAPPPVARSRSRRVPPSQSVAPGGQPAVHTPNGVTLPLRERDGVKIGHLVVGEYEHELAPNLTTRVWGYNGRTPGPTIECVEGDRLRIYVTNRLPEPTTVHWHGLIVPNGMDGVSGLNQRPIEPGGTHKYEFVVRQSGTFMYHSHYDEMTQIALGCVGMFIAHPRRPRGPRVDRDFVLMTHEWKVDAGARRPNANAMNDFNVLTFNGKAFPSTEPLLIGVGERVRIRLGNLSPMDHHPIHIHGLFFETTDTDGGVVPPSARLPETTVLVPVGSTRVIELVAQEPGDWAMHCHMTHHVMMQMGHITPMIGVDAGRLDRRVRGVVPGYMTMGHTGMGGMAEMGMPVPDNSAPMRGGDGPFSYIDMGGMFTILKVREDPSTADPNGWYQHPPGTVATDASAADLRADEIDPSADSWG